MSIGKMSIGTIFVGWLLIFAANATPITTIPSETSGVFAYGDENIILHYDGQPYPMSAGVYTLSVNGEIFNMVSVDIFHNFSSGDFTETPLSTTLGTTATTEIASVLDKTSSGMDGRPTPPNSMVSAAIQMAVWKLEIPSSVFSIPILHWR